MLIMTFVRPINVLLILSIAAFPMLITLVVPHGYAQHVGRLGSLNHADEVCESRRFQGDAVGVRARRSATTAACSRADSSIRMPCRS